jgi:F-type H+-transporting ATPase subunit delta
MKGTRAAQRYAKAILDLAKDQNVADSVNRDMESIAKTIIGSKDLQDVLASPALKAGQMKSALREIFKGSHDVTFGAFDVLIDNKRIALLKPVAQKYTLLYNELNKIQVATVTTAVPLDATLEAKILDKVKELTGHGATIENKIDPSIIGGFILRIGDLQYNASVSNNLNNLQREFKNNAYISKI